MSSIGQATSSISDIQSIVHASLADYARITGIDLSSNPLAASIGQSKSPEVILQLLQGRATAFQEYRNGDRRLISCLSPTVKVIQAFSGILGETPFQLASGLFGGIDALLAAASGVTSSYDSLLDVFECLGNFLKRLDIYTTIPPTPIVTDIIVKIMVEILSVLALATKQLEQGRFKKFAKKMLGNSEIEATLQRLDRLTQDEARVTVTQALEVVYGLVGNLKVVMEDGKASMDGIQQILVVLQKMSSQMNKMNRDQLQGDVQHWLSPPDPSTNHSVVSKARHSGTAAWFLESDALMDWKVTGSFLWIHGKPGAGKSTFLSAVIQDIEGMRAAGLATVAYYYFDFRDVKKQDCYGLLSSLVLQLSAGSDSYSDILSRLYSHNSRGIRKPTIDALKNCFMDVLSVPGHAPIYIIVDALDECPNSPGRPSVREEVLELMEEVVDLKLPNVRLCVASRPEMDLRMVFEPLTSLNISLHDESGQKEDIIAYIKSIVCSDRRTRRWKKEDQNLVIDTLSQNVDGMFRWVVCKFDLLRHSLPVNIESALDDPPKGLDETYERSLLGINEGNREYARRLFQCLSVSIRPLRVEELAEILAFRFNKTSLPIFNAAWRPEDAEEAVISVCSSLVTIVDREGSRVVQFSHLTVKQFLASERLAMAEERLSYYHILPEPAHTILAHAGLSALLQLDDEIDRSSMTYFPLAPYAARNWADHAQFGNVSAHIQEVMERLFDPTKPHFAAWVWLYDIDRHWIEPMSEIHPTRPEAVPLYYASLCGFRGLVEHLIAAHSPDINSKGGSYTTPLHAALAMGHLDVASLLLINGADPNSRDNRGRTPLHRVSQGGQLVVESSLEIVRLLVNCGADMNITDDGGQTPLHPASQQGHIEMVRVLVELGIDVNPRDHSNWTPLHEASQFGHLEVVQFLLEHGADTHASDQGGWTSLQWPSYNGDPEIVRVLLKHGVDANAQDNNNWTPLHCASQQGHREVAQVLLEHGTDPHLCDDRNDTPLHLASRAGHLGLVQLLIESGADIDVRNNEGRTPLDEASVKGHDDVMQLLLKYGAREYVF